MTTKKRSHFSGQSKPKCRTPWRKSEATEAENRPSTTDSGVGVGFFHPCPSLPIPALGSHLPHEFRSGVWQGPARRNSAGASQPPLRVVSGRGRYWGRGGQWTKAKTRILLNDVACQGATRWTRATPTSYGSRFPKIPDNTVVGPVAAAAVAATVVCSSSGGRDGGSSTSGNSSNSKKNCQRVITPMQTNMMG